MEAHRKYLQLLCKTIYEVDSTAMIVKYKHSDNEEEIMESNAIGVAVKVKNGLMNYAEAILKCL